MNNITLSGRTVRVSKAVEYTREDGSKAKLTYVTLAVRGMKKDPEGGRIDDIFTLKFYDELSDIAQKDLNLESPEKLKAGNSNPIHSRVISVAGRLNVFEKEKDYTLAIEFDLSKEDAIDLDENYILEKEVDFQMSETQVCISVNQITFLDARPDFAKENKSNVSNNLAKKIKARVKSYRSSAKTMIDDMPV